MRADANGRERLLCPQWMQLRGLVRFKTRCLILAAVFSRLQTRLAALLQQILRRYLSGFLQKRRQGAFLLKAARCLDQYRLAQLRPVAANLPDFLCRPPGAQQQPHRLPQQAHLRALQLGLFRQECQ